MSPPITLIHHSFNLQAALAITEREGLNVRSLAKWNMTATGANDVKVKYTDLTSDSKHLHQH
jgi:hypothetical protein